MMGTSLVANGVHSMGHLVEPRGDKGTRRRAVGYLGVDQDSRGIVISKIVFKHQCTEIKRNDEGERRVGDSLSFFPSLTLC